MVSKPTGTYQYDFAVYDRAGRLSALVEAKRRFKTSPAWARHWHVDAVDRASGQTEAIVVLVTPERIYAWDRGAAGSAFANWELEANTWLMPYFNRLQIAPHEVAPHVFEQIVGLWLRDVTQGELPRGGRPNDAGAVLTALQGGEVVEQAAA